MKTPPQANGFRRKIKDLTELASVLAKCRASGKKVAHCHGVFDPLHIGHIRHFEQARKLGDILVVTVTPDRFVNKGPHRPVFPESLRAESIAALEFVDYVAVNEFPMAVETIKLLKPDIYVKGSEFRTGADRLGAIGLEDEAVRSVGGKLGFTDDITFSASNLVNRHLPVFPKQVSEYLAGFSNRFTTADVLRYLENARPLKVLTIGEAIVDDYSYCEAIGKSSKEPTLVVKHLSNERFAGGILAVANHVANFSDHVSLLTFLGDQNSQEDFIRSKLNASIDTRFLYRKESPTIVKRRFIENYFFQKLFEVYEINDANVAEADNQALCSALKGQLAGFDLVVVFDFGHGMLTQETVDILCDEAPYLVVNTQSNAGNLGYHSISKYHRADYVCIAEGEARLETRDRRGSLESIVQGICQRLNCGRMVVTRGKNGCLCYSEAEGFVQVPALAGQVVDRIGAGDAFLSVTALCAYQQAPMEIIGFVGNVVGAQAAATVGHRSSIERVSLVRNIEHLLK